MKMKYDESDNAFIRASRAVTDRVTDLIGTGTSQGSSQSPWICSCCWHCCSFQSAFQSFAWIAIRVMGGRTVLGWDKSRV